MLMVRRAFTLIELLVVIAIIAILAAILFPVFASAKEAAKAAAGIAQMRQLSLSVMMYTSDYDETLVPSTNYDTPTSDPNRIWTAAVFPYVKNEQIFVAPGASGSTFARNWSTRQNQSVGYNDVTAIAGVGPGTIVTSIPTCQPGALILGCSAFTAAASTSQMEEVASTGLFANTPHGPGGKYRGFVFGADNGTALVPGFTTFTNLKQAVPLASGEDLVAIADPSTDPGLLKPIQGRYQRQGRDGRTPVVFADGHTKSIKASTIQSGASGIIWRFR